jgi:V/A-type H+-transporting ATPase subunit I
MFRAIPMMRLRAVVLERDERAVLKGLGQSGAVQLTHTQAVPDAAPLVSRDRSEELAHCCRIRTRLEELRRSITAQPPSREGREAGMASLPATSREVAMTLSLAEATLTSMEERLAGPLERRRRLAERQRELIEICARTSPYRGLDLSLDRDEPSSFLHFVAGSLPLQNLEYVKRHLGEATVLVPLGRQKERQSLVAATTNPRLPELERTLERAGFQREVLPTAHGITIDALCEDAERETEQVAMELSQLNGELDGLVAEFARPLREIEVLVDVECRLLQAAQKTSCTEEAVLITGWAPASAAPGLRKRMEKMTDGRYVLETAPADGGAEGEVPVLLRHSRLIRPFEMLVSTYGLPSYREVEPTIFVALSYMLMFGMMFGDAGHGLVLASCGLLAVKMSASRKMRDLGLLLLLAGSSSVVFGVVYGSYFGIGLFKRYALWHDPLEGDPLRLMFGAIGFGIAMISLGLILNVINRFRRGDVIGGFLDKFGLAGLLFYWGSLVLLVNRAPIASRGLMGLAIGAFLVLPMVGWVAKAPMEHLFSHRAGSQTRGPDGIGSAVMESFVGAFEAILSYLANTISFVRLAAYAMSHAALLVAAFMLAEQVGGASVMGGLWSVLVAIVGNAIAIVLEGIIASVQALRLEYYEFFGKFFSGAGQPFEPFLLSEDGEASAS